MLVNNVAMNHSFPVSFLEEDEDLVNDIIQVCPFFSLCPGQYFVYNETNAIDCSSNGGKRYRADSKHG